MRLAKVFIIAFTGFCLSMLLPPIFALEEKNAVKSVPEVSASQLVGKWQIVRSKEPGQPYRDGHSGRPFVFSGVNAFTLILEYNKDNTFRKICRVGNSEKVQEGTWRLSGHELRQRSGGSNEEVLYLRFDSPNQFTSTEVYEDSSSPGLFVQFNRVE